MSLELPITTPKQITSIYFENIEHNQTRIDQISRLPPPNLTYVIYFTPRSGSSRISEILSQTKILGEANEAFNPNFIPGIAQAVQARNMDQYIHNLSRWQNRKGIFGFEITEHQLRKIFPQVSDFFDIFGHCPSFWLIREDIVAQAVSLAKMVALDIAHTAQSDQNKRDQAEKIYIYDRKEIKRWLNHILIAERNSEKYFAKFDITPLRLSYERLIHKSASEIAGVFAQQLGKPALPEIDFSLRHKKMGTSKNQEFAEQFRCEESHYLEGVANERQAWLAKLSSAPP